MGSVLIGIFTVILLITCVFLVFVVLMQRPSTGSGLGGSMGGGAAESIFGGESSNVLTRWTIYGAVAFFALTFILYLAFMARYESKVAAGDVGDLPSFAVPAETSSQPKEGSLTQLPTETSADKAVAK